MPWSFRSPYPDYQVNGKGGERSLTPFSVLTCMPHGITGLLFLVGPKLAA